MAIAGSLLRAVFERPWAIDEQALRGIVDACILADGAQISRDELQRMLAARQPTSGETTRSSAQVAVIPVHGVITQGQGLFGLLFGGTTVDQIATDFRAAMNDRKADAVVLDVNSPGGTIDGIEELASLIRASRGRKPIVAVANGDALSAAYWIACAADEIAVTPTGSVGSIGVFTAHQDVSVAAAKAGVTTTLISYGKHKVEGNPFEPLGDEARATIQERVNYFGRMFDRAVARGRGVTVEQVRADFGQGRSFTAEDAVRLGLADREATLLETVNSVGRGVLETRSPSTIAASGLVADGTPVTLDVDRLPPEEQETEPEAAARSGAWQRTRVRRALASVELNF